jgi:hypothetical protein
MTVLAAPATIISTITYSTGPITPATPPRRRSTITHTGSRPGRNRPANADIGALTALAEPPRRRDDRPAGRRTILATGRTRAS